MINCCQMVLLYACIGLLGMLALGALTVFLGRQVRWLSMRLQKVGRFNALFALLAVAMLVVYGGTKPQPPPTTTSDLTVTLGEGVSGVSLTIDGSKYEVTSSTTYQVSAGKEVTLNEVHYADGYTTGSTTVTGLTGENPYTVGEANCSITVTGTADGGGSGTDPSGEAEAYFLYETVQGAAPSAASTFDGYLYDANGNMKGTLQVKVGKPNRKTKLASVKATVIGLDGKKKKLKAVDNRGKALIAADGPTTVTLTGGETCTVTLGAKGMSGTYGSSTIDGARNVFMSRDAADKTVASAMLGNWKSAVNVAWPGAQGWNGLSVTIAAKGRAKVAGTLANGTKVRAKGQLAVGEDWCCVPVVVSTKAKLAFNVWLPKAATSAALPVVIGLGDAIVGKPGALNDGAKFDLDGVMGDAKYEAYLPDGVAVKGDAKWTLPKAGKVQLTKDGVVDESKLGENPSALKLTYKAKDGSFKGSFKVYADANGKPKATTVKVVGVLVKGVGYGVATIRNATSVPVTIK